MAITLATVKGPHFLQGDAVNNATTVGRLKPSSSTAERVYSMSVVAKHNNAGRVFFGESPGLTTALDNGLGPGDSLELEPTATWMDLRDFYLLCDVANDGIDIRAVMA